MNNKLPTSFRVLAILAVLWNALGIVAYLMEVTMSPESLAALPPEQRELYETTPGWVTGAFAIAVFSGFAGSIALAMRRGVALPLLVISLVAAVLQMAYQFGVAKVASIMGPASMIMPAVIILIGAGLVWLCWHARRRGWIAGVPAG